MTPAMKNIIIILIVLALFGGTYFYFSGSPTDSESGLTSETSPEAAASVAEAAHVLSLLNQINSIHIDTKFFESTVFKSLVDNQVVVPEQNVGRPNPFVAVPGTFVAPAQPSAPRR
jgi:predicted RNase H-related nuclease YkuK (DUF458 family)